MSQQVKGGRELSSFVSFRLWGLLDKHCNTGRLAPTPCPIPQLQVMPAALILWERCNTELWSGVSVLLRSHAMLLLTSDLHQVLRHKSAKQRRGQLSRVLPGAALSSPFLPPFTTDGRRNPYMQNSHRGSIFKTKDHTTSSKQTPGSWGGRPCLIAMTPPHTHLCLMCYFAIKTVKQNLLIKHFI